MVWGDFGLGGILTGGILSGGISAQGDFVLGGFCPWGFIVQGFIVQGGGVIVQEDIVLSPQRLALRISRPIPSQIIIGD